MIPAALVGTGLVLAVLSNAGPRNNTSVQSSIDGNTYQVQNLPNRVEAANKLAGLRQRLTKLIETYKNDPASISDPRISILVSRFNPNNFCENDINADYLIWIDLYNPLRMNQETLDIFVLPNPRDHFRTPGRIVLAKFLRITGDNTIRYENFNLNEFLTNQNFQ